MAIEYAYLITSSPDKWRPTVRLAGVPSLPEAVKIQADQHDHVEHERDPQEPRFPNGQAGCLALAELNAQVLGKHDQQCANRHRHNDDQDEYFQSRAPSMSSHHLIKLD